MSSFFSRWHALLVTNAWCDTAATLCVFSLFPFLFRSLTSSPLRHASRHPLSTCRPFLSHRPSRRLHPPSPWDTPRCRPFACHPGPTPAVCLSGDAQYLLSAVRDGDLDSRNCQDITRLQSRCQCSGSRQLDFDTLCVTRLSPPSHTPQYLLPNVARLLLEHGADINAWIDRGSTTLHVAVRVEVVRVLLEHGANLDAEDNKGRTPLYDDLDHSG